MRTTPRIAATLAALLLMATNASAALLSRAGGQAYYDDVLNITWLANANLADTNDFGVTGINANGTMSWTKATEWIAAMNTAAYLGVSTWRLPTVSAVNGVSFDDSPSNIGTTDNGYNISEQGTAFAGSTASEMAHLFYNTLNNKGYCDPVLSTVSSCSGPQAGWGLTNPGPFTNLQPSYYWSGTTFTPSPTFARDFYFGRGFQNIFNKSIGNRNYAWAVSSGDIAAVPVPAAAWLLSGALALMCALRRRTIGVP